MNKNIQFLKKIIKEAFSSEFLQEAIIMPFDFSKPINKLKKLLKQNESITLDKINEIFKPANVIFTDYKTAVDLVKDKKQKDAFPSEYEVESTASARAGVGIAMYNEHIDKLVVVISFETFLRYLKNNFDATTKYLEMVLNHENIHKQQVERSSGESYQNDVNPMTNPDEYFSQKEEIMAFAKSAVDEMLNLRGYSKEDAIKYLKKGNFNDYNSLIGRMRKHLSDKDFKRFIKYFYLYLTSEDNS